jgi:hypothetical protein
LYLSVVKIELCHWGESAIPSDEDNIMSRQFVQMLSRPATFAAGAVDRLGVFFLLALGLTTGGASLLAGF